MTYSNIYINIIYIHTHTHPPLFSSSNLLKNILFTRQKTQSVVDCILSQFFSPPSTLTFLHLTAVLPMKQSLFPTPRIWVQPCELFWSLSGGRNDRMPAPWLPCFHAHSCHFHYYSENNMLKLACWS